MNCHPLKLRLISLLFLSANSFAFANDPSPDVLSSFHTFNGEGVVSANTSEVMQTRPPYDTSPHPILPELFQLSPELLRSECGKCHSSVPFAHLNVEKLPLETLPAFEPRGITCTGCHSAMQNPGESLRVTGNVQLDSGHLFTDGKAGLCVSCHQSWVRLDLEEFIATNPAGPHYGTEGDVLMGINAWNFRRGRPYENNETENHESIHKLAIQDSCVACHMAKTPANGTDPVKGVLVGGHSFRVYNTMGTASTEDDVSNLRNACMPCHLTITSVDRVLSTSRDYDGDEELEGTQSEVRGLLSRIANELKARHPAIVIEPSGALTFNQSLYAQLPFVEKAAVYNHRFIQRDGSAGIHNPKFAIEVLQGTYEGLVGHSLKVDAPNAYMVGNTDLPEWMSY